MMFTRGPPRVYLHLRRKMTAERFFEGMAQVAFEPHGASILVTLSGETRADATTYSLIRERLRSGRRGSVVRMTVAAAEAAALADFGGEYLMLESSAKPKRFTVAIKAKDRSASYVLGIAGRIVSKKVAAPALLDSFV
jgi:hypothetical protein